MLWKETGQRDRGATDNQTKWLLQGPCNFHNGALVNDTSAFDFALLNLYYYVNWLLKEYVTN